MDMTNRKERHIVSWSQEEDDILREQIHKHGTDNWSIIASKFNDKTPRQCRRRWYTYLNSDFKKGGWSQEEDMLLCEAQKIFGNRWTEIAKVVSGRTDNAVKNRFSTLCKKRAKHDASTKENIAAYYLNPITNKRVIPEPTSCIKKMRSTPNKQIRPPFTVLSQNIINSRKHVGDDGSNQKFEGTYLKKDDPKITALMQQAELLSSLAVKVKADNTIQSLENAWKVIQEFINGGKKGGDLLGSKIPEMGFELENMKELIAELSFSNEDKRIFWSSENSTGSATGDMSNQFHFNQDKQIEKMPNENSDKNKSRINSAFSSTEFSSPLQVTRVFGSTPKFSESERQFLMKTLGLESSSSPMNASKPPNCKRALINSL
ncbi:transcription factor MYB124-like isoform X2 [Impatiens glandulifera]|uniref:transcription factor MYB124-like isoform X2 n=1 Tax=Impatiens glandulifera TaxID=253017 RepID=UPI001FB0E896|nr:transcription factor MYB124-like isoform X2 [Impatiens glandulifera]